MVESRINGDDGELWDWDCPFMVPFTRSHLTLRFTIYESPTSFPRLLQCTLACFSMLGLLKSSGRALGLLILLRTTDSIFLILPITSHSRASHVCFT